MSLPSVTLSAGTAGVAAAGAGMGVFSYNRGNYTMDQKLHYTRYTAGVGLSCAQVGMYRQDLTDLIGITANRMHLYIDVAGMTATIITALFCPGRVGLHTPPPPEWLMGLFMFNLGACYLWLGLTIWLGIHASLRSDVAVTHMLTRFVRLPIPSQYMLDRARKFLSSWEEQPWSEVFRIPLTRHMAGKKAEALNESNDIDLDADTVGRTRHGTDVPHWYRMEKEKDHAYNVESMMPENARGTAPEHFEVFRELQNEWWPYDAYCRICMFLAYMHLAHAWSYHQLGHHLAETRSVFAVGTVILPLCIMQHAILSFDIMPVSGEFPFVRIGPCAQWVAYVAVALEYKRWFTPGGLSLSMALVYITYFMHIVYTLTLYRLCSPDLTKPPAPAEIPGSAWWPAAWHLPSAFQHTYNLVAPPRALEYGQHDLAGEMRAMHGGRASNDGLKTEEKTADAKRRDVHRALGSQEQSPAWFSVKVGLIVSIVCYVWLVIGYTVTCINQGTVHPMLLNAPGMPNNARDPRYRPAKVGAMEATEVGTGGAERGPAVGMAEEGVERRLQSLGLQPGESMRGLTSEQQKQVAEQLRDLLPYLNVLASQGGGDETVALPTPALVSPSTHVASRATVQWPALFEPRLLACGPTRGAQESDALVALALSRHGRGAIITNSKSSGPAELGVSTDLAPFVLEGITGLGALLAGSWDQAGLLLTTFTGTVIECPGSGPTGGRWRCAPHHGQKLPFGNRPFSGSVAIGRHPTEATLRAAVIFPGEPSVTMLSQENHPDAEWFPTGEVRTHGAAAVASFANSADALLLSVTGGAVSQLHMGDGSMIEAASPISSHREHVWQASCSSPAGRIVRLALAPSDIAEHSPIVFLG